MFAIVCFIEIETEPEPVDFKEGSVKFTGPDGLEWSNVVPVYKKS